MLPSVHLAWAPLMGALKVRAGPCALRWPATGAVAALGNGRTNLG